MMENNVNKWSRVFIPCTFQRHDEFGWNVLRRVHGVVAMGQSLMPWYSATASASLVSRLQIDGIPLEGMIYHYFVILTHVSYVFENVV